MLFLLHKQAITKILNMSDVALNHFVDMFNDQLYQGCDPNVWGGYPQIWTRGIDLIVDCDGYFETVPESPIGKTFLRWKIEDGDLPDAKQLNRMADLIISFLKDGKKVFVHCAAGQNRSALLVGVVLNKFSHATKLADGLEVYNHIKTRNPLSFTNPVFVNYIKSGCVPTQSMFLHGREQKGGLSGRRAV